MTLFWHNWERQTASFGFLMSFVSCQCRIKIFLKHFGDNTRKHARPNSSPCEFWPYPHQTSTHNASKWNLLMWMGVFTLNASNIVCVEFAQARPVWIGPLHDQFSRIPAICMPHISSRKQMNLSNKGACQRRRRSAMLRLCDHNLMTEIRVKCFRSELSLCAVGSGGSSTTTTTKHTMRMQLLRWSSVA